MAKNVLPVNFQDDILNSSMGGKRRYNVINNPDGTISLEDVTEYDQVGSDFGQAQINATNMAVNESADKNKILDSSSAISVNTQSGYMAGALAVKELITILNNKAEATHTHDGRYYTETEINNLISGFPNIYAYSSSGGTLVKINGLLYATKTLTFSSGTATWNISSLKPESHTIANVLSAFIDSGSSTYVINSLSYSNSTGIITARCLKISDGSAFTGSVTVTFIMAY